MNTQFDPFAPNEEVSALQTKDALVLYDPSQLNNTRSTPPSYSNESDAYGVSPTSPTTVTMTPYVNPPIRYDPNSSLTLTSSTSTSTSPTTIVQYNPRAFAENTMNKNHPMRKKMKSQRKGRTAGAAVGGAVVGALVLGPVGFVLGGAGGAAAGRKICKTGEKRAERRYEQKLHTNQALDSSRAIHSASFA